MGTFEEASAAYRNALTSAALPIAPEHQDVPVLYAVADAYAGMGDVLTVLARHTQNAAEQSRLWSEARASYQNSLNMRQHIPNPATISPSGFRSHDPKAIASRLASLLPGRAN
jgi:hypothetical protein